MVNYSIIVPMNKTIEASQKTLVITILLLWLGHFCVDFMIGVWPIYKTIAEIDLAKAGLISTCCVFIGEGLQFIFGSLSDKGYRKILVIGGLILTAASTTLAYTENYILLFFLYLCTCLGSGAFHPAATSWMGGLTSERKSFFITLFSSGGYLGMAISQIIFSHTFYLFSGHTLLLALPLFATAAILSLSRLASPSFPITQHSGKLNLKIFRDFFKRRDLSSLYISQVCNQSLTWGLIFLLPDILKTREYDSWISFGGGHFFLTMGSFFMLVPAGYLADKYSSRSVILCATAIGFGLFYLFLFSPLIPVPLLLTLLFLLGASLGIVNPVSVALGNRLVPENPGMISAFLMGMVWCVSEGIGQGGGGLLTKLFEEDAPARALGIIGAAFFIGFAASLNLPKKELAQKTVETISDSTL
jgi:MFS transporter, FSR family, fosmidomycin resistance protein